MEKVCYIVFRHIYVYIVTQMRKLKRYVTFSEIKHYRHLRNVENTRLQLVFSVSLVFSNTCCVLSQCNTQLGLLYLLNIKLALDGSNVYNV